MINIDDIHLAAGRIAPYIRRTPLMEATALKQTLTQASLWLKLECLQVTGSFKIRGATNKLLAMSPDELANGVVTASGGNHGLALAHVVSFAEIPATIFVPRNTSPDKIDRLKKLGACVEVVGAVWNETNIHALEFAKIHGAAYFHPFADPLVVAGQGTLALELLEENPDLDKVLVVIGGGGLISGMSVALKALKPSIKIIGIEPTGSPTFHASLAAGKVVRLDRVTTRVATMACAETDSDLFELSRHAIDEVVLIDDEDMLDTARWLWSEFGLAADLSGAAACAALRTGRVVLEADCNVCALVCGSGPEALVG